MNELETWQYQMEEQVNHLQSLVDSQQNTIENLREDMRDAVDRIENLERTIEEAQAEKRI